MLLRSGRLAGVALLTSAGMIVAAPVAPTSGQQPTVVSAPSQDHRQVSKSGAWCWFGDPRAVYYEGERRQTYVGWIDQVGNIRVASFDHDSEEMRVRSVDTDFEIDDHNTPSLLVRPNGRLMIFWSGHAGPEMYYRISTRPEDITRWGPTRTIPTNSPGDRGYTYPNPIQLSAENNRLFLFWRGGNFNPTLSVTDDLTSWSPARTVMYEEGQRPYTKFASNGVDRIGIAYTDGHPRNVHTSIYYAEYYDGAFHRIDGSVIATMDELPFDPREGDLVYDAHAAGPKAWVHDVAYDADGNPVIAYANFPTDEDHRYRYARWNGTTWVDHQITRAGGTMSEDPAEPNYSGGITLDQENPSVVYLSRQVDGVFEVEEWRTVDGGRSWSSTPVTSQSTLGNYRPFSPYGHPGGDLDLLWMHGAYPSYVGFRTSIWARMGDAGPVRIG
jgi:BNR repeat-containing family member